MKPRSLEKKERALGVKLFLKGERCNSQKCAMIRRPYRPGMHGKRRRGAASEYAQQLLEKQKVKITYGLKEAQLYKLFKELMTKSDSLGQAVIGSLERRIDNTVFRLGFAPSRTSARQYVSHGHFLINNRKITIPSCLVKVNDIISIRPNSKKCLIFKNLPDIISKRALPGWLEIDKDKLEGRVKLLPKETEALFDINLVVDYYSR